MCSRIWSGFWDRILTQSEIHRGFAADNLVLKRLKEFAVSRVELNIDYGNRWTREKQRRLPAAKSGSLVLSIFLFHVLRLSESLRRPALTWQTQLMSTIFFSKQWLLMSWRLGYYWALELNHEEANKQGTRKPFCRTDERCWTTRRLGQIIPENQPAHYNWPGLKTVFRSVVLLEQSLIFEIVCGGLRTSLSSAIPSQYSWVGCINRRTGDVEHKLVTQSLFSVAFDILWLRETAESTFICLQECMYRGHTAVCKWFAFEWVVIGVTWQARHK